MDHIQRKLAQIDAQLSGSGLHYRLVTTAPLVFPAIGLIAGILLQDRLLQSPFTADVTKSSWLWLAILAILTGAAAYVAANKKSQSENRKFAYLALACFACLGAIRLIAFEQPKPNDIRNLVHSEKKLATIRGIVLTQPYVNSNKNWQFAALAHTDPTASFYIRLTEVETTTAWQNASGKLAVYVTESVLDIKPGDHIQASCWLDRFKHPTNPGQFNAKKHLARKNIYIAASVESRDAIILLKSRHKSTFSQVKTFMRQKAAQGLLDNLSPDDRAHGLLQALLLGHRRNIDARTYHAFEKTGLLHFISLSGMHLGILIGTIWFLLAKFGLPKPARAAVSIIALALFILIVPARAPTLRAAIIAFFFCTSFFFRRRPEPLNTLALAAIILLLIRPTQLFEPGWQLSFTCVLGIILFTDPIHFFLYEKITAHPWKKQKPKSKPYFRIILKPGPYILQLFCVGLAAWLGGAGVLLWHFYTINPLTPLWTVLVFPLVAAVLTLGFCKIILSLLLPSLALLLGILVSALAELLLRIVSLLADLNISEILIGRTPALVILCYYALVLFARYARFSRPLLKKAAVALTASALVLFLGAAKWNRTHRDHLAITCLDVGHGQAILAQLPGRENLLFDAGSLYKPNVGRRIVAPFLKHHAISKIHSLIISHNDVDHINAIPEIIQACNVGSICANDAFFSGSDQWQTAEFLSQCLHSQGRTIEPLRKNLQLKTTARLKILWPAEDAVHDPNLSDNDRSLVILIEFAGRRILLCSDIEEFAQRRLLRTFPRLKADIVIAPHHGSAKTLEPAFLKTLQPEVLICSCSRSDYRKHRIIDPIANARCFYTARSGALTCRIDTDGSISATPFSPPGP